MNAVAAAIKAKLDADATLTAMLGAAAEGHTAAVYHRRAPEGAALPYVIFFKSSGIPKYTLKSRSHMDLVYTIKGVCESPADSPTGKPAADIDARVDALIGTDGTLSITGKTQLYTRRIADVDYPEQQADRILTHVGGQYRIWSTP